MAYGVVLDGVVLNHCHPSSECDFRVAECPIHWAGRFTRLHPGARRPVLPPTGGASRHAHMARIAISFGLLFRKLAGIETLHRVAS